MKLNKDQISFKPRTICEVGTGGYTCVLQTEYILDLDCKFIFVEANPVSFGILNQNFGNNSKFKLYNVAVADENKKGKYYTHQANSEDASGYIEGINSSAILKGYNFQNVIEIDFIKFSEIDDGTIDILIADIEGAEYFLLKNMISRPKIIILETVFQDKLNEINTWMTDNNYTLIKSEGEDSMFVKNEK